RFSASAFLDDVREFGATTFTYVGKAVAYLLAVEEQPEDGSNTLTRGFGTEASSPDRVRFEERFGCRLVEGYGSSEGGVTIVTTPQTPAGALGPAPAGADLAVVDPETGDEMARAIFDEAGVLLNGTEAIGEIVNRAGSGKFEGYYADPLAEGSRVHDGWYWTGDLAYRDSDGYFFFAGRSGDWLRVDSENLAATPIEAVMARFEAFAGVAIYPVPDVATASGDAVMLAAELRDGTSFDPDAFSAWLGRQSDLGTKWTPSFIRLVDTIDETATGKITKVRLKLERWRCDDVVFIRHARSTAFLPASAEILDDLDARLAAR
ncbi:MAG: AMP-binding protein, partial [Actinomycetes bacterium]